MQISGNKIPIESQFMTDFWKFRKQFYIPEDDDRFWEELISAADALYKKYNEDPYLKELILACASDIEKRYRKTREGIDKVR